MTDPMLDRDPVLAEVVSRLVSAFHPERIYLFGSKARGDADRDSDYDLMLILPSLNERRYRLSQQAYRVLRGVRTGVDVLVWSKEDFDSRLHLAASLPATIAREGTLLYAA